MSKRKFTDEQELEIAERYRNGENTVELGKAYGVNPHNVYASLRRSGVTIRGSGEVQRKLAEEQEREIAERRRNGESNAELAREYGVSDATISNILKRTGVVIASCAKATHRLTDKQKDEIARRYLNKESTYELAEAYGVTASSITYTVKRSGGRLRANGENKRKLTEDQELEAFRRYNNGETATELGRAYGVSPGTVSNILRRNGVATRGSSAHGRAARFQAQLQQLVESLGDHINELPLKSWLLILQQSDAIASIGEHSLLSPIKVKLLEGKIGPDDLAATGSGEAGGKLQAAIDELLSSLSSDELERLEQEEATAEPTAPAPAAEPLDVEEEPQERRHRLAELSVERLLEGVSAASRVLRDEEALSLICSAQVDLLWQRVFNAVDPTAVVAEARGAVPSSLWAATVRDSFLEDWGLLEEVQEIPGFRPGPGFQINLMQRREAALLRRDRQRLNISAMGAGKTLAALAGVHLTGCRRVLVLAPNNALKAWTEPLTKQFPGSQWQRKTWRPVWGEGEGPQFLLCNHEMLSDGIDGNNANAVAELLAEWAPDAVVIDEIHQCKNRTQQQESQRHRNLLALTAFVRESGGVIYGMSGTPVINELSEAISLLKLVQPAAAAGLESKRTIGNCLAIHQALQPLSSRYIPKPPCGIQQDVVTVAADELLADVLAAGESSLATLDAVLAQAKIPALVELCRGQSKVLVFTSAVAGVIQPVRRALEAAGLGVVLHTGDEDGRDREESVKRFAQDPGVQVLLASSGTLATGFDGLQLICSRMIFLSLPWTAAEHEQAVARLVRQGTPFSQVHVTTLVAELLDPNTGEVWSMDQQKLERLTTKRSLGAAVCDGVIPDKLALQYKPETVQRELKRWAQRINSQPVAA